MIPFLDYEKGVLEWLSTEFAEVETRGRFATMKDPETFRFNATRFIGRLKLDNFTSEEIPPLGRVAFEVQVRTAFEHAWSVATHALAYKGASVDWRKIRLAAQLKASVEQLDLIVKGFDGTASAIEQQRWPSVECKEEIEKFFRAKFEDRSLPDELRPGSWVRFCETIYKVLKGKRGYNDEITVVRERLAVLDQSFKKLGPNGIPLSLTLTQLCIGVLAENGIITSPIRDYVPLMTDELKSLYPKAAVLGVGFNFELSQ